jgi:hypothetical protein
LPSVYCINNGSIGETAIACDKFLLVICAIGGLLTTGWACSFGSPNG